MRSINDSVAAPGPAKWLHRFHTPDLPVRGRYRNPSLWLNDLLRLAFPGEEIDEANVYEIRPAGEARQWELAVQGTERVLRFVCVLLNQHAEQSPADPTPPGEAERLEETLAGPPVGSRVCPNCGEDRWKIDGDLVNRSAVVVHGAGGKVWVDRCGPDGTRFAHVGSVTCERCAYELNRDGDAGIYEAVVEAGETLLDDGTSEWAILTDYRQF